MQPRASDAGGPSRTYLVGIADGRTVRECRRGACQSHRGSIGPIRPVCTTMTSAEIEGHCRGLVVAPALDDEGRTLGPLLGVGAAGSACGPLLVSDALVSSALETGKCQVAGPRAAGDLPRSGPVASVPLMAWPHTVGALVVFALLAHRSALRRLDLELLELLSSHAATAIQLADLRSAETRHPPSLL